MAAQALTPEQAVDVLTGKVRGPAILHKLAADWNIHPRTPAEAYQLLELADHLHEAKLADSVKTASATGDPFLSRALHGLRQATGKPAIPESLFKEAAAHALTTDPEIAAAAIGYIDYLTAEEQLAAQPA
jgi:hypothetical protein